MRSTGGHSCVGVDVGLHAVRWSTEHAGLITRAEQSILHSLSPRIVWRQADRFSSVSSPFPCDRRCNLVQVDFPLSSSSLYLHYPQCNGVEMGLSCLVGLFKRVLSSGGTDDASGNEFMRSFDHCPVRAFRYVVCLCNMCRTLVMRVCCRIQEAGGGGGGGG